MAIVALVVAIASFVVCPVILAVVALVLCSSARRNINASGGTLGGSGLVTAARIVAWINIGFAVLIVGLIILIAIVGHNSSSITTNNLSLAGKWLPLS